MTLRRHHHSNVWIYQCKVGNRTVSRSTGQTYRKKAEREISRLRKEIQLLRARPNGLPTLSKAIVDEVALIERDISVQQARRCDWALRSFVRFAGHGDWTLDRFDSKFLEDYQRDRLGTPQKRGRGHKRRRTAARATVVKEIALVRRMFGRYGIVLAKPSPKRGRRTPHRVFTQDELRRFFAACPPRYQTLYQLMLATGARQAELVPSTQGSTHTPLLKKEVDLSHCTVTIRSAKRRSIDDNEPIVRTIPIAEDLAERLRREMDATPGPFVFLPSHSILRDFQAILKRAGIEKIDVAGYKITSHSFRHTWATWMGRKIPLLTLKAALGHTTTRMTEKYAHIEAEGLPVVDVASVLMAEVNEGRDATGATCGCNIVDMALRASP